MGTEKGKTIQVKICPNKSAKKGLKGAQENMREILAKYLSKKEAENMAKNPIKFVAD